MADGQSVGRMTLKNITSDDEGQILKIKYLTCMNNYRYCCRCFNDLLTIVVAVDGNTALPGYWQQRAIMTNRPTHCLTG